MRVGTITAFLVGAAIATAAFTWQGIAERTFGRVYRVERSKDLEDLRRIAYSCLAVKDAADAAIADGVQFKSIADLTSLPPAFTADMPNLHILGDGEDYVIYYKLNWDAGIYYNRFNEEVWEFDAGLGEGGVALW